jgi:signal transduction histidine kinase
VGDTAAGDARPPDGGAQPAGRPLEGDLARVAASVREVVGARAAIISRVVDDEWLEVLIVSGEPSFGALTGLRWRRSDLDGLLAGAERLGRLHATKRERVTYAEVPDSVPETERYVTSHLGLLIAPLSTSDDRLLGVLATEGPVELAHPAPGTCDLVELYAGQARLALSALRAQETVEELQRLDEYRRDLVASITHDLKTPLTAIALNTELLESDKRLAEAGSYPVAAIRRSADRLTDLVDDLLAMARADEAADTVTEVDLVQMVRDACGHSETEATLRGVTFDLESPEHLWAFVDPQALARVFANLVSNAVKFSLPRGKVILRLARLVDAVEFQCTDEGIGIPEDRLATLFDLARRTPDSRTDEMPGSGIGLAICQRIVTRLGGEITVESKQAHGSVFTVRIPLTRPLSTP